jgi:hypothetical protein
LINDEDRDWFRLLLGKHMKADFNMNFDDVVKEPVLYGDFIAHTNDKSYQEIDDLKLVNTNRKQYDQKITSILFVSR